jgi:hypothetical protein
MWGLSWRAMLLLVAGVCIGAATGGALLFPTPPIAADVPDVATIRALAHWDAGWYAAIASEGYWYQPNVQSPVAYFPLYPLVVRAVTALLPNRWLAAELVTLLCGLGGCVLFRRWAQQVVPAQADAAFAILLLYPFSFYLFGVVYSDALYLVCGVGAFLALERGHPVLAAVLGVCGTACRPIAPALVVGLLVRSLERRRRAGEPVRFVDGVPALAGAGLLAYMAFLGWRFGDPLAFAHVQSAPGWDQAPGWNTWLKLEWFRVMFPSVAPLVAVRLGGHALVTGIALALVPVTVRRLGWGYGLYVALAVGIPAVSSKDFMGLGRYLLAAFPLFATLASLLSQRAKLRFGFLAGSGALLVALAAGFGAGGYVS